MRRRVPALIALLGILAAPVSAQSLKQVVESLTAPSGGSANAAQSKKGAADQLPWVEERIKEARERSELADSEGFQSKIRSAGFPENRPAEIQREAGEAVDAWISSKNLLDWIVVQETVGIEDRTVAGIPANTSEALDLERQLDDLKNQLARFESHLQEHPESIARAEQQSRSARRELAELRQEAESPLGANARDRSDVEILQATIREDNANAQVFFQRWLGYRLELEKRQIREQSDKLAKTLRDSGFGRLLTASRATAEIARLQKNLPELDEEDQRISQDLDKAAARLAEARSRLEAASANGGTPTPDLQKEAQAALAEFSRHEFLRGAVRARSYAARHTQGLWNRVLEILQNTSLETLEKARADLELQQPTIRDLADRIDRFLSEKQDESDKWRQDLRMPGLAAAERSALQDQIQKNQALVDRLLKVRDEASSLRTLQNRLLEEINAETAALSAGRRWDLFYQGILSRIEGLWNFQITSQGDRDVTLGTIITAILALAAALVIARISSRRISATVERRMKLPGSRAHLVEKLTLYALSVVFVLMVLQWLQIPLTVFAFLGGALAVGIGFGSQNLINNFISGLLLLLEQKINVGDLVEVDGNFGRVTDLGSRCSAIRKFDGVEVLVPNSSLLEKNVINWTLSDPTHRFDFPVGVAYDSDVDLVMRTLHEALDAQPEILREPAPEVSFENFGESTLDFHVYFWLEVGSHNARDVGTHLRVLIARLFKERGIEMAFPQRDVRLIPAKPLEIRLGKDL